jgi:hypothetical protein
MPVRPELRHLYRTPEWRALRAEVFKRSRGRCEQCGKPAGPVYTYTWQTSVIAQGAPLARRRKIYHMVWMPVQGGLWTDQEGRKLAWTGRWPHAGLPRRIFAQLGAAHVDPAGEFFDPNNVRVWCDWCHLHHDQEQHHFTRAGRRDRQRPILQETTDDAQRPRTMGGIHAPGSSV